jgi:hypothetical protein
MPRGSLTKDEKLEVKHYLAQEFTARVHKGTLHISTDQGASDLILDVARKFDITPTTARKYYAETKENRALFLPVHEILQKTITNQEALLNTVLQDIKSYGEDYKKAVDAAESGTYGSLRQKAIQNASNILKSNVELLHKVGGLSIAARRLALDEERLDQSGSGSALADRLNYESLTKEEIDSKFADLMRSGKTTAHKSTEIVARDTLISDGR